MDDEKKVPAAPKKRGSKSASITANLTAEPGEISQIIQNNFQYFNRKPPKDNDELAERLNGYFRECREQERIPTVENMALALGVTRGTLWDWENRRNVNPERTAMIKKAKELMGAIDADLVAKGKIPQITYIFRAKNYYGMKDQQDVVLTPNTSPLGEQKDAEGLQKKYLEKTYGTPELPPADGDPVIVKVKARRKKETGTE